MNDFIGWLHIASDIGVLLAGCCGTVFWWFYRRNVRRDDKEQAITYKTLEAYGLKLDSHARQIRDTRAAVACCETELEIEHYPYTD